MKSRIFGLLSLLLALSSVATALPANPLLEAKGASDTLRSWLSPHPTSTIPFDLSTLPSGGTSTLISGSEAIIFGIFQTETFMLSSLGPLPTLTLSTFSEVSPIWSHGSPLTLSSLAAGLGFSTASLTVNISTGITELPTVISTSTSVALTSEAVVTSIHLTSSTSTVLVYPSKTTAGNTTAGNTTTSNTTAGAVAYSTSTSKAMAPTLVAGLGSLLGVALGAVALL